MKNLYIILGLLLLIACGRNDLDQAPPLEASSASLDNYAGVLNAAYYYQQASTTPMAVMGDFRADNMLMEEEPYPAFDRFNSDLAGGDLVGQFFQPFYSNLYKSILSANNVISNSTDNTEIGEAQFLRALSYFKLVQVFGDVTVNLEESPSVDDKSILARTRAEEVYSNVIIPDFEAAISALDNSNISSGRASKLAAQGLLGKVYMHLSDFNNAERLLATVVNDAPDAGIMLLDSFADIFAAGSDLNAEVIYATQQSSSINDEYGFTLFPGWFSGGDTKSLAPLDPDLIAAFDESSEDDLRREVTINEDNLTSPKYGNGLEQDWIELRLGDVILLYAEALNESNNTDDAIDELNKIRNRAGLDDYDGDTDQATVRQVIADERRLELALEGHRWFDLVRTGTVSQEMGISVEPEYYVFPLPDSEILASDGAITQNEGY